MTKRLLLAALASFLVVTGTLSTARAEETIVTPTELKWRPLPNLPSGAQVAPLYGDPQQPGPYVYRVKFPANYKVAPHSHADERTYTILSGTLYQGEGEKFDEAKLKAIPAGSFSHYASGGKHFAATKEEVIFQVNGNGPTAFTYVNPADDPRQAASGAATGASSGTGSGTQR